MFTNTDSVIDSRDIIERIEELESILSDLWVVDKEENPNTSFEDYIESVGILSTDPNHSLADEYLHLKAFADECELYTPDWQYGETLIHRNYFKECMDEMIEDCYELPRNIPYWMSITLDYDTLEMDYVSVYLDGEEYLIRSC